MNHDLFPQDNDIEAQQISPDQAADLVCDGMDVIEDISPMVYDRLSVPAVAQGIVEASRRDGEIDIELLQSYLIHSNRLQEAAFRDKDAVFGEKVVISQHEQNLHENGMLRREESGLRIRVENLETIGIDPWRVLMFRATQASNEPVAEYYWTSDPTETLSGLNVELGERASSAIILIDSLAAVAENGGLLRDINDGGGVAVRQIGFGTYDQKNALATFKRSAA